jgi:hypothetical protein
MIYAQEVNLPETFLIMYLLVLFNFEFLLEV